MISLAIFHAAAADLPSEKSGNTNSPVFPLSPANRKNIYKTWSKIPPILLHLFVSTLLISQLVW